MASIKLGTVVRQKVTPIEGPVTGYALDESDGSTKVRVDYTNESGEPSQRYFEEDEVEIVPTPAVDPKKK